MSTAFMKTQFLRRWLTAFLLLPVLAVAQSGPAPSSNSIDSLQVAQQGGTMIVKVGLRQPLTAPPSSFSVADPARIVFDFPQAVNGLGRSLQPVDQGELRNINIVQAGDRTRMVFNLKQMAPFETRLEGNDLLISLRGTGTAVTAAPAADKPAQHFAEVKGREQQEHAIRDLAFRRSAAGEGVVTIDLADSGTGIDVRQQGNNLVVEFLKAKLPENLRRKLDVTDFATPISSVTATSLGENVRVVIAASGLWEHAAYQTDNQFVVQVKPIKEDPNKLFQGSQQRGYQGEKISLNFQNIPVRELLYVFADITGFNIFVADNVAGSVSLRLNDVPWDQALEIVMQQQNLAMRKNGNVIQIGRAAELAKQEEDSLKARQALTDLEPTKTESFQVNYQKADAISRLLTDPKQPVLSKRGTAVVDAYTNRIFVTDTPGRLNDVRQLVSAIDIPARQVLIEAKFVQATKDFNDALGARLSFTNTKGTLFGRSGGNDILMADGSNPMTFSPSTPGGSTLRFALFNADATRIINLELQASERDSRAKTISSPRVVAENNSSAKIADGTTFYLTIPASGNQAATSTTIDATLSLTVTPQITPDGKVKMKLQIAKKSLVGVSASGANVRNSEVTTDATVDNGGTLILGGVTVSDQSETVDKVPFLGDIPILGSLFRYKTSVDNNSELLVFITPRVLDQKVGF